MHIRPTAIFVLSLPFSSPLFAETLNLSCIGGGSANQVRTTTGQLYNNYGDSVSGSAQSQVSVGFADQVDLKIEGGTATIRMPRSMLPIIRGGENGWMTVKKLQVTEREITGSVAVNPINNPKLHVDRVTGILTLNGKAGSFAGECRAYDPSTAQRKF